MLLLVFQALLVTGHSHPETITICLTVGMVPGPCRPKPFIIMKTRTFLLALLSLLIPAVSSAATSSGLVPTQCNIGHRNIEHGLVFGPISSVGFIFDVGVSVTPEAKAYIKNGDETIAEGSLSCSNYTGKKRTQGTVP